MASLNDYKCYENGSRHRPRGRRFRSFWLQIGLSAALLAAIAAFIGNQGTPGQTARYLANQAISTENSWFTFGRSEATLPASAQLPLPDDTVAASPPKFMAPASGVVVKGLALGEDGFTTEQGIVIQGVAGQSVKAAAAGEVIYLGESSSGFMVEIQHEGGFSSIYKGLSELSVGEGQEVAAGASLGITENGELLFALFSHDQEVDPLVYLFQQQI